jgi:hypothetical protein
MTHHLFQATSYPLVHYPSRKPLSIRRTQREGKEVRLMTFRGVSAFGIPQFPTANFEDFAWVPKALLGEYFEDDYFEQCAWTASHNFL